MTVWAGRLTPQARVEVDTSTWMCRSANRSSTRIRSTLESTGQSLHLSYYKYMYIIIYIWNKYNIFHLHTSPASELILKYPNECAYVNCTTHILYTWFLILYTIFICFTEWIVSKAKSNVHVHVLLSSSLHASLVCDARGQWITLIDNLKHFPYLAIPAWWIPNP